MPVGGYNPRRFAIYQGDYRKLAEKMGATAETEVEVLAEHFSKNRIVVLTHAADLRFGVWPAGGDCRDIKYPRIAELIASIRRKNPQVRIFGYVSGTADAPAGTRCGYYSYHGQWQCGAQGCRNFVYWVEKWRALQNEVAGATVDGIMVDLVSRVYLQPAVRDNIFSYLKRRNLTIMANTPLYAENAEFALASPYFPMGSFILDEGFKYAAGADIEPATRALIYTVKVKWGFKKINLAALATEEGWSQTAYVACNSNRGKNAYKIFASNYFRDGDVFAYMTSDLGIRSHTWTQCDF